MADEGTAADAVVVEDGPAPDLAPAVDDYLPGPAELAVVDPADRQEVMVRMDDHDVRMLLEQVQSSALRKWVYALPDGTTGLTVHAVQDITQRIAWTGKARIGLLPETLSVEQITQDAGNGPEPFWVADIAARDEITGNTYIGTSMEPQRMRLKPSTAQRKRNNGAKIPEDNTIFDVFSRTKAIQKASRNALAAFIPEEIEQTVLAMFANQPDRVERIQTEQEAKVAELPPPLDDDEARALVAECRSLYDEIREAGGGKGKVDLPPGQYHQFLSRAEHSHERLRDFRDYLAQRREEIAAKYGAGS